MVHTRLAAAALGAVVSLAATNARADTALREDLFGHEARVDRSPDGALTLVLPGAPAVALAAGGTPHARRVPVGAGVALVIEVDGASPALGLVAGSAAVAPAVLFAGPLVHQGEDIGDRFVTELHVADFDGDRALDVILGERRDDVRLCALGRPLVNARVVSPATLRLAPVALNPLRSDVSERPVPAARELFAIAHTGIAPVLPAVVPVSRIAHGASQTPPAALTDGAATTAWSVGDRESVTARVALAGMMAERIVLTAPAAPATMPRNFTLLFEPGDVRLDVTVPAAVATSARIAVPIVPPRELRCLSLVVSPGPPGPARAIAELAVATEADRAADPGALLVARLDGRDGDEAAQLLIALGDRSVPPLQAAFGALPEGGARRAIRVLAAVHTSAAAGALTAALGRPDVADDARLALQRMGPVALDALAALAPRDARAADLIATMVAPLDARLTAMAAVLASPPGVWHDARGPARALVAEAARGNGFDRWLALIPAEAGAAARALTVAAEAATSDAQRASVAARARSVTARSFDERFRLLRPLVGDAEGRARVADVARHDPDDDLRAEAVRALAAAGGAPEVLVDALGDRVPRVRIAAAEGLARVAIARTALLDRLEHDGWPSVRAAAAGALAGDAANVPALARATEDASHVVDAAAISALSRTDEASIGRLLIEYAERGTHDPDMRVEALAALSRRCEHGVVDRLMPLFLRENDEMLPPAEQAVGHAALAALAHIDPTRARAEFARLQVNAFAAAALQRAMQHACPAR